MYSLLFRRILQHCRRIRWLLHEGLVHPQWTASGMPQTIPSARHRSEVCLLHRIQDPEPTARNAVHEGRILEPRTPAMRAGLRPASHAHKTVLVRRLYDQQHGCALACGTVSLLTIHPDDFIDIPCVDMCGTTRRTTTFSAEDRYSPRT